MRAGPLNHRVTLQSATTSADADAGYTQAWAAYAERIPAGVLPATVRDLERLIAHVVQTHVTHLVTIRYRSDVTTAHRLLWHHKAGDKTLSVTGVYDPGDYVTVTLACVQVGV